ncbi:MULTISPECIES: dTDP-4-dehydrorhamnose 3,5-epimerase [unclassified Flagellimonas]|uniref:dTDP-4-dehydrorhamnose 3,5-epimerase n=1 Tax=Flagellimonas sp. MMG031 TaxID=3158549 RepID=A0AAU7MZR9_9FLAO
MQAKETILKGCYILEPTIFKDDRGYFFESYNHRAFCEAIGSNVNFVQDNQSYSKKGVLRGLHFQKDNYAQAKLVSVIQGIIQDVVVDLRKDSPTFGEYLSIELSAENKKRIFVPRGFAHGFLTLSDSAVVIYKCDNYYNKASEGIIRYDNKNLGIKWNLESNQLLLSDKDMNAEHSDRYLK